jgi:hypothetical protein
MNERQESELEDGNEPDVEAMASARKFFHAKVVDAAFRGDSLAASLLALEHVAEPFLVSPDYDDDDSDLDFDIF